MSNEDKYTVTAIRMFYSERRMLKQLFPSDYAEWDELPDGCRESWILAARERFI